MRVYWEYFAIDCIGRRMRVLSQLLFTRALAV